MRAGVLIWPTGFRNRGAVRSGMLAHTSLNLPDPSRPPVLAHVALPARGRDLDTTSSALATLYRMSGGLGLEDVWGFRIAATFCFLPSQLQPRGRKAVDVKRSDTSHLVTFFFRHKMPSLGVPSLLFLAASKIIQDFSGRTSRLISGPGLSRLQAASTLPR